ncbi:MAG: energy transducer TonB [Planctomycetes bacterium]|nr:energy transducer TonB [Planctomycetota bacterium]
MNAPQPFAGVWRTLRALLVVAGALAAALLCFLVLPLLQAISSTPDLDLTLVPIQTAELPPPPPVEDEPPPEPEKPKEQPKLDESAEPLDLAQLEMALNASLGDGGLGGELAVPIPGLGGGGDEAIESLFSLNDLDQKPRALHQPQPVLTAALRKKLPAKVTVLFVVDQQGRVQNPIVQSSSDPSFEAAVLQAIQQWKFEPGKRDGQPVRSRMRQPFQFEG